MSNRFGERLELDQLDLSLERCRVVGYLGPNGASNSTTLADHGLSGNKVVFRTSHPADQAALARVDA